MQKRQLPALRILFGKIQAVRNPQTPSKDIQMDTAFVTATHSLTIRWEWWDETDKLENFAHYPPYTSL